MNVTLFLPLVLPAVAVPAVRSVATRIHPATASRLTACAAMLMATASTLALGLLALAGAASIPLVARIGGWSRPFLWHSGVIDPPLDIAAAIVLGGCAVAALAVVAHRILLLRRAHRAAPVAGGSTDLVVVVDDDRPLAHALPGRRGRIVVSRGMLRVLDAPERRALLAHERAHLTHFHHLLVSLVDVAAAAYPLLYPLRTVIRYQVERWADESAAESVGSRTVVASAVGRAALAQRDATATAGIALAAATGPVPRRVAALLAARPSARLYSLLTSAAGLCVLGAAVLLASSTLLTLDVADDLHHLLELAQASSGAR